MRASIRILDKYSGAIFCIGMALLFFFLHFEKIKLRGESDLKSMNTHVESYSFLDNLGWRKDGRRYIIKFEGYSNEFQIIANHLDLFDKARFQVVVSPGHQLLIKIPKEQKKLLNNSGERIMIIEIRDEEHEFLNSRQVILKEQGPIEVIAGFGFLVGGFIVFVIKRKKFNIKP